ERYPISKHLIEEGRSHLIGEGLLHLDRPVRILQGMCDPDVPWGHALDLVDLLCCSDLELTLIKDGDHRQSRPRYVRRLDATGAARWAPPRSRRRRSDRHSLGRLGLRGLRRHGAAERFLDGVLELILRLYGESAILLETFGIENALFSHPAQSPNTQRDDVNGQACNYGMQLLAKLAWRTSTGLFAVGHDNNEAGLVARVEHICRLCNGRCQRRFSRGRQSLDHAQDG